MVMNMIIIHVVHVVYIGSLVLHDLFIIYYLLFIIYYSLFIIYYSLTIKK